MTALLLLLAATYSTTPAPGNRFTLQVEKTGLMKGKKHLFSFPQYTGNLQYDPTTALTSKVEFTLDGASMVCEDDWVKESDRKKILEWGLNKMIEVGTHPKIRFVSGKVEQTDPSHYLVTGLLTMRGVSQPAALSITAANQQAALTVEGTSTVDMKQWGMKPPSAALGAVGTKPEMLVRFHLVFTPAK